MTESPENRAELPHNMRRLKPSEWKPAEVAYPTSRVEIGEVFFTVDNRLITKWENEDV